MNRQHGKKSMVIVLRKTGTLLLTAALLATPVTLSWKPVIAAAAEDSIRLISEEAITSGAILKKYEWTSTRGSKAIKVGANVIQVDLQNPNVKLDVMTGKDSQFTKKQSVRNMATETGAVAGVNGDFFNTQAVGVPIGPEVSNGKLESTPPFLPGWYSFGLTKDNKPVIEMFTFKGSVKAKDGAEFPLGGINKLYYWYEPNGEHSHIDSMFIYTSTWGQDDRANDRNTDLTEVLVQNDIVKEIVRYGKIPMIAPEDGYILRTEGKAAQFVMDHIKVGDKIEANYEVYAQDPTLSYDAKTFKMMIGGHTILVDGGKPAEFSRPSSSVSGSSPVARTSVGYSQDGRYVYMIAADKSSESDGLTLAELQKVMIKVGVWKGMNLDGGGSTQMVSRPLGENNVQLVNDPGGYERPVVNGLGVFSTAPKGTKALSMKVTGPTSLLVGEKANYNVSGYDEYYNPFQAGQITADWSSSKPVGTWDGNTFTATQKGKTTFTAVSGNIKQTYDVQVVGREDIASMVIEPSVGVITDSNEPIKLSVRVKTKSGAEKQLPGDLFQWEIKGAKGQITGDTLQLESITDVKSVELIARYDGFSSITSLGIGYKKLWADFDKANFATTFAGSSADVKGEVKRVPGFGNAAGSVNNAVYLGYDMTAGTGTKAAYAVFSEGGIAIEGEPKSLSMNVKGDNSRNWLRAEIFDATGKKFFVEFTKSINWGDWKTVTANLASYSMTYPIKLSKIYVANPEQGQDERELKGSIVFDDLTFHYQTEAQQLPRNQIKLTVDKKTVQVNGNPVDIEQAPVIVEGNTLVPGRFVVEALKGEVLWTNEERKVTIYRGSQMVELWLDNKELNINGKLVTAEVPPVLMNEFTMVPLRILSENLGWKVSWDQETKTVTLE
ncbi:stalk domain-containing protein [Paenibacillus contaminans]|uniref:Copper amine oxidase n=1 Tax=Paenibacillus contaminans TaxID=450362 RepID=A0A329MII2_9BACL|nr:stalk domain-containing protein [Paenibacillus contaminans]RAV17387.1 copper amine oxidase [Paenibacillus contaminans]